MAHAQKIQSTNKFRLELTQAEANALSAVTGAINGSKHPMGEPLVDVYHALQDAGVEFGLSKQLTEDGEYGRIDLPIPPRTTVPVHLFGYAPEDQPVLPVTPPQVYSPTRRDFFAAQALQALIAKAPFSNASSRRDPDYRLRAKGALNYADAMIRELDGTEE